MSLLAVVLLAGGAAAVCSATPGTNCSATSCSAIFAEAACTAEPGCEYMPVSGDCVSCPECACFNNNDCPNPADSGEFCLVRDCWAGLCMDMPRPNGPGADDGDACTQDVCVNVNGTTFGYEHQPIAGCCNTASDCMAFALPCTEPACIDPNATTGTGTCDYPAVGGRCCVDNATCDALFPNCITSYCEDFALNDITNFTEGLCSDPVEQICPDLDPLDRCNVSHCAADTGLCVSNILGPDLCPGACCIASGCNTRCGAQRRALADGDLRSPLAPLASAFFSSLLQRVCAAAHFADPRLPSMSPARPRRGRQGVWGAQPSTVGGGLSRRQRVRGARVFDRERANGPGRVRPAGDWRHVLRCRWGLRGAGQSLRRVSVHGEQQLQRARAQGLRRAAAARQ